MAYEHRDNIDRAKFMDGYVMFEDLENNTQANDLKSIVTGAYASGQQVKHKGDIVETIMEMGIICRDENHEGP
eukprot:2080164-Heterocapsa_arctica.AAC.1